MFSGPVLAGMRDRTASCRYSPAGEAFRRAHKQHRSWGLRLRHAERLRHAHADINSPASRHAAPAFAASRPTAPGPTAPRTTASRITAPTPAGASPETAPRPYPRRCAASSGSLGSTGSTVVPQQLTPTAPTAKPAQIAPAPTTVARMPVRPARPTGMPPRTTPLHAAPSRTKPFHAAPSRTPLSRPLRPLAPLGPPTEPRPTSPTLTCTGPDRTRHPAALRRTFHHHHHHNHHHRRHARSHPYSRPPDSHPPDNCVPNRSSTLARCRETRLRSSLGLVLRRWVNTVPEIVLPRVDDAGDGIARRISPCLPLGVLGMALRTFFNPAHSAAVGEFRCSCGKEPPMQPRPRARAAARACGMSSTRPPTDIGGSKHSPLAVRAPASGACLRRSSVPNSPALRSQAPRCPVPGPARPAPAPPPLRGPPTDDPAPTAARRGPTPARTPARDAPRLGPRRVLAPRAVTRPRHPGHRRLPCGDFCHLAVFPASSRRRFLLRRGGGTSRRRLLLHRDGGGRCTLLGEGPTIGYWSARWAGGRADRRADAGAEASPVGAAITLRAPGSR
ncbi:hypothetical protein CLV70_119132 [Pseudosporangium ferrugineum]|uniref:Uncharacterized protein n=1 Tax=Pseudosporangium ferrugineum TaxID=439699 RepID=A0A2T0RKR5_9ACTN|nr:hypothetical protein CLV70_119132 [Pseudosporangium ferrugineum]